MFFALFLLGFYTTLLLARGPNVQYLRYWRLNLMFFDITKVHQLNLKHQGGTGQPSILILLSSGLIASKLIALNSVNFKSRQTWDSLLGVWGVKIKIWTCVVKFIKKKAPCHFTKISVKWQLQHRIEKTAFFKKIPRDLKNLECPYRM